MAVTVTRAATSLLSVSSAMEAVQKSFEEGDINITSLISSFSTIAFGARQFTSIIQGPLTSGLKVVFDTLGISFTAVEGHMAAITFGLTLLIGGLLPKIIEYITKLIEKFKYSDTELKIREINKNIKDQQEQLNNLNSTYNDTISLIDELNSKKDTFAELEVGTVK